MCTHTFRLRIQLAKNEVIELICDLLGQYEENDQEMKGRSLIENVKQQYLSSGGYPGDQGNDHLRDVAERIYNNNFQ